MEFVGWMIAFLLICACVYVMISLDVAGYFDDSDFHARRCDAEARDDSYFTIMAAFLVAAVFVSVYFIYWS